MTVMVDGRPRYTWAISTGLDGGPPSGTFRPQRLERMWHSRTYDWSPMPHSIFFHHGFAIHGTNYVSRLGRRASHGCVRLHPSNAATLFALVKSRGMGSTTITVSDSSPRMSYR
jgi:lipoprotein-anchoring transpeptidase ErfK/SrfK